MIRFLSQITRDPKREIIIVSAISFVIAGSLLIALWDINFWPTDTKAYILDAAREIPSVKNISELHSRVDGERTRWLRGKEMFALTASWAQQLMGDTKTLRPFIIVCLVGTCCSGILIFLIARTYWGRLVGWTCFFLFMTSFWSYQYVLMAKQQPLGLLFALLSIFMMQSASRWRLGQVLYFFSGISFGLAFFSSTVSTLYFPYIAGAFVYVQYTDFTLKRNIKKTTGKALLGVFLYILGGVLPLIYFTYPDILGNIQKFLEYVEISSRDNHFRYNLIPFQQWIQKPADGIRGGWPWIFKYFILVMPVLFYVYLVSFGYLLVKLVRKGGDLVWTMGAIGLLLLSCSSPVLAEIRQVAQYGANYFTTLIGILMLIGFALHVFLKSQIAEQAHKKLKNYFMVVFIVIGLAHLASNAYIFAADLYPSRMATTLLSREIERLGIDRLYSYQKHPHRLFMIDFLNPPILEKVRFTIIDNIYQIKEGYILVPPATGKSVYIAALSGYRNFDRDLYLNQLFRKNIIERYAVSSFRTLASSRIWAQEEETLAYLHLILNEYSHDDFLRSKAWLLDAKKIYADATNNMPSADDWFVIKNGIQNIGTKSRDFLFAGHESQFYNPVGLKELPVKMYRVGNPTDQLKLYVFSASKKDPAWTPYRKDYVSKPYDGKMITADPKGEIIRFLFDPPVVLNPGFYKFAIYRTGDVDDQNYYRIYVLDKKVIDRNVNANQLISN